MNKLLTANLIRLKKSKLFWITSAFTIIYTWFNLVSHYETNRRLSAWHEGMEDSAFVPATAMHVLYDMVPLLGLLAAFMIAVFIGTEYHDNTMRNKLICGQSRANVYLVNLLTCFLTIIIFYLLPILMVLLIGIPLLGMPKMTSAAVLQLVLFGMIGLLISMVYASICTLIGMLVHNRSYSLMVCMLFALVFLMAGSFCESRLDEPEYFADYSFSINEDGTQSILPSEPIKNPSYLEGNARRFVAFLYDFLPGGQAIQIASLNVAHNALLPLYSIGIIGVSTLAGLAFFKRKDLK